MRMLTSAALAAVMFASGAAWAQENQPTVEPTSPQAPADSSAAPQGTTKQSVNHTKKHVETTTKQGTQKAETKVSNGNGSKATSSSKAKSPNTGESQDVGEKVNESIVGEEQEKKNEAEAAKPHDTQSAKEKQEAHKGAQETGEAVGKTTTTAAEAVSDAARDVTRATDQAGKYNPFSVEFNPLGLFVDRVSVNLEWAPATHHAIILSPHFADARSTINVAPNVTQQQKFIGGGTELGYRYYSGHRGLNGLFAGGSLIGGIYSADLPGGNQAFTNFGFAVDVGIQQVFFNHLLIGGGVGLQYLWVSHDFNDLPTSASSIASQGIKPRLLLSAGYAF